MPIRRGFIHLVGAFALLLALSITAHAQDFAQEKDFNIPPQALSRAIIQFSDQSGIQVVTAGQDVSKLNTAGVKGRLTIDQALKALLKGTPLGYSVVGNSTVTLGSADSSSSGESDTSKEAGKKSSQDFRVAQMGQTSAGTQLAQAAEMAQAAETPKIALQEIIVTAQKREERLIDTPQSVSVLTAQDLSTLGATQFRDFANLIPGLEYTTSGVGSTVISMRGVGSLGVGSTVGVYVDDVPFGSSSSLAGGGAALDVGLFDVDRIEALRGPQGTLYGASTMGGLLKYVSTKPDTANFSGEAQAGVSGTAGGGLSYNAAAVVNAPISANIAAVRISGYESRDGGYIDNPVLGDKNVNRSDVYGGRLDLLITPTDALNIRVGGFYQNISRRGTEAADYTLAGAPVDGDRNQRRWFGEPTHFEFRLGSVTVGYDFSPAALTSVSSYQTTVNETKADYTAVFLAPNAFYGAVGYGATTSTDKFTEEVRLASTGVRTFEWLIGGFYTHESSQNSQGYDLFGPTGESIPNNLFTYANPSHYEEYAGFGDLTYHLTPALDVSGGVRYAQNRQDSVHIESGLFGVSNPLVRSSEGVTTYLANARYHFNDRAMAYLRYATGYRPGGPNFITKDPATGLPFGPESFASDRLKSYEIGSKAQTADQRFSADLALYTLDWQNTQIVQAIDGFGFIVNAPGGARMRGGELTLGARPIAPLTLTASLALQHATLNQANAVLGAAAGERLPNVPRTTASAGAEYVFSSTGYQPSVGATLRYVSDRTTSFNDGAMVFNPQYRLPAYTAFDVHGGLTFGGVNLQMYAHNLFNKQGQLSGIYRSIEQVSLIQPRTIGITAASKF